MSFRDNRTRIAGGPINYYNEVTTNNTYDTLSFGGNINTINITNDSSTDTIQLSYDGATLEADIKPLESMPINVSSQSSIRVKGTTGGGDIRIWGW